MTLTTEEARRIAATREMLAEIGERIGREYVTEAVAKTGDVNLYNLGRFREAIDATEHALFNLLNTGKSFLHCEACQEAIDLMLVKS